MSRFDLARFYADYIACLNARDWDSLQRYVARHVIHNDRQLGLDGYRRMLESDVAAIPDLRFAIEFMVCDPPRIGSRLRFDCTPVGRFMGLDVNGSKVSFAENVFYELENSRIARVWSIVDKAAIEQQLRQAGNSRAT